MTRSHAGKAATATAGLGNSPLRCRPVTVPRAKGLDAWRVPPGKKFKLAAVDPASTPGAPAPGEKGSERKSAENATRRLREQLRELQDRLHAEGSRSVLLVLQAMDTGGKDGTVKNVFFGVNPVAVDVHSFGVPSEEERAHDFLWRIHNRLPADGRVGIFNRSHYEDVLAVRVRNIAPKEVWEPRFAIINDFERGIVSSGTAIVKVMLHISNEEQRLRLQARIDRPDKRWKYRSGDLEDRRLWDDYIGAYDDAIERTSTEDAPWFVVPADKKWYRDWAVLTIMIAALEAMSPQYPAHPELDGTVIP